MLSERDLKALRGGGTTSFRVVLGLLLLFAILQAFYAYHNLGLALEYARSQGFDLQSTLQMWNAEPELQKLYSGFEVQSLHRLHMAILSFGTAALVVILAMSMISDRAQKQRVLAELERVGAVVNGKSRPREGGEVDA